MLRPPLNLPSNLQLAATVTSINAEQQLHALVSKQALQQVRELAAGNRFQYERGESCLFHLFARFKVAFAGKRDHRNRTQRRNRLDSPLDDESVAVGEVDVQQDEVGRWVHFPHLLRDVCAGCVSFEADAQISQN